MKKLFAAILVIAITNPLFTFATPLSYLNEQLTNRRVAKFDNITFPEAVELTKKVNVYNWATIRHGVRVHQENKIITIWAIDYRITARQEMLVDLFVDNWLRENNSGSLLYRVKKICRFIASRVTYNVDDNLCFTSYGAYKGRAACQGMSLFAKKFYDKLGITNELIVQEKENHMYNRLCIYDKIYDIDIVKYKNRLVWNKLLDMRERPSDLFR